MQLNPEYFEVGDFVAYPTDGSAHITWQHSGALKTITFDTAHFDSGFGTGVEKVILHIGNPPSHGAIWFVMTAIDGTSIPCRLDTAGNVYMCNYTGRDLTSYNFYGQVVYVE